MEQFMKDFEEFKLTKKQNNKIIPRRKLNIFSSVEAYYKDSEIVIHYYTNILGKVISVVTLPIVLLFAGVSNAAEVMRELKGVLFQKKNGAYVSEFIGSNTKTYHELEIIYLTQKNK